MFLDAVQELNLTGHRVVLGAKNGAYFVEVQKLLTCDPDGDKIVSVAAVPTYGGPDERYEMALNEAKKSLTPKSA